jgi:hypothetical protein
MALGFYEHTIYESQTNLVFASFHIETKIFIKRNWRTLPPGTHAIKK